MSSRPPASSPEGSAAAAVPRPPAPGAADVDGLPPRRRLRAVLAVSCAVALSVFSMLSVGIALPVMARDLQIASADAVWIMTAFQLTLVGTLFPFSALGEQWGYGRLYNAALLVVAASSVACAAATSFEALLAWRVVQGLGNSALMAVTPALLRLSVPAARYGRAIGVNAMIVAIGVALAPSVAALVLSVADWSWLFLLNVPWALLALAMGVGTWPAQAHGAGERFDAAGAVLNMLTFGLVFAGIDATAAQRPGGLPLVAAGAACAVALWRHQRSRQTPMLPLDLLRIPVVRLAACASVFAFGAQMAAMVALPFLLHDGLGRSLRDTGLLLMCWPAAVAMMAPVAGWLDQRIAPARLCAAGSTVLACGLLLLATLSPRLGTAGLVTMLLLCGMGFGAFQTPNNRSMLGATPRARSGSAGGLQATARLTGQTLGTSSVGLVFHVLHDVPQRPALAALALAAACALLAAAFSLKRVRVG